MSKYLEALKRLRQETCPATYMADFDKNECCDVIEQALQRLEAIENAEPSEALKLVGYLKDYHLNAIPYYDWLNDIEKYILKAQKEHKALEIIKNKTVDIWLIQNKKTLKEYNSMVDDSRKLIEEEFDLLKEVLGE